MVTNVHVQMRVTHNDGNRKSKVVSGGKNYRIFYVQENE